MSYISWNNSKSYIDLDYEPIEPEFKIDADMWLNAYTNIDTDSNIEYNDFIY